MFVGLLKFLFVTSFISTIISWIFSASFAISAARSRRPDVRFLEDLKGNAMNALLAKKWLTADGIKYRGNLFRALLAFTGSLTLGALAGLLLNAGGNL
jgi:hypothetical protein